MITARKCDALRFCSDRAMVVAGEEHHWEISGRQSSQLPEIPTVCRELQKVLPLGNTWGSDCWPVFREPGRCKQERNDLFTPLIAIMATSPLLGSGLPSTTAKSSEIAIVTVVIESQAGRITMNTGCCQTQK